MFAIGLLLCHFPGSVSASETSLARQEKNAAPDAQVRSYDGRTLDEWREIVKSMDFQSPSAAEAVPGLLALVEDEQLPWFTRRQAALTLGRIGKPAEAAVPVLAALLESPAAADESSTAAWAAKALSLFGPVAAPATPALVRVLTDETRPHLDRLSCIEALGRIGGAHNEGIPALIRAARDESGETHNAAMLRQAAVDGIALAGNAAAPAVPTLVRLTRDDAGAMRKKAAAALGSIGSASAIAVPALVELMLFDDLREVREAAARSLAMVGSDGERALQKLLTDQSRDVRLLSAEAMAALPRSTTPSIDALELALDDPDSAVRIAAAESLWALARKAEPLLPILLKTVTSEDRQVRIRAYRLLIKLGPAARPAVPDLRRMAEDDRPHVRQAARKALEELQTSGALDE